MTARCKEVSWSLLKSSGRWIAIGVHPQARCSNRNVSPSGIGRCAWLESCRVFLSSGFRNRIRSTLEMAISMMMRPLDWTKTSPHGIFFGNLRKRIRPETADGPAGQAGDSTAGQPPSGVALGGTARSASGRCTRVRWRMPLARACSTCRATSATS